MTRRDLGLAVFEPDELRENFFPLSLTRPTFDFLLGSSTILKRIERAAGRPASHAVVPKYLEDTVKQNHQNLKVNENCSTRIIVVNALVSPRFDLQGEIKKAMLESRNENSIVDEETGALIFSISEGFDFRKSKMMLTRREKQKTLKPVKGGLTRYPWQLLEENSLAIFDDFKGMGKSDGSNVASKCEVLGSKLITPERLEISSNATIDTRKGPVIIGDGVTVESFSLIQGPVYIGANTIVKSARIRGGTSIGEDCRVSGELEETIIFDHSNKNHEGFLGHSLIGSWVNLGALTTNSDLKNTYGEISVTNEGKMLKTGSNKVGVIIGDMAKTAIGVLIYSGKKIGVSSHLFGTVSEDVPSFSFYAKSLGAESVEIFLDSAIETQSRMMKRRGKILSNKDATLIKTIFKMTAKSRLASRVKRGRFRLTN
ncbi:MAG: putative sugar nucleotidyl transferase [Nitrososphaerales archaeon]